MPTSRQKQIDSLKSQIEKKKARLEDLEAKERISLNKKRTHVLCQIGGAVLAIAAEKKPGTNWENFDLEKFDSWLRREWLSESKSTSSPPLSSSNSIDILPPTAKQVKALEQRGIDPSTISSKEEAQIILTTPRSG